LGANLHGAEGVHLLDKLDGLNQELGFAAYTSGVKSKLDVFCTTAALMVGTAGLPHVIIRFFTVRKVRDARISAGWVLAGYFGIYPRGSVAQVVALAFGLAASSFFPAILLGIFSKRMNKQGAISGMLAGITFTAAYIIYCKLINQAANVPDKWLFGISPEGIGTLGMVINFAIAFVVSAFTAPPPEYVQALVEEIRIPKGADLAHEISA
jgi:Na+(H+)/acetate symporter ActP